MAEWGPAVAEELRRDVRFALGWKVGKKLAQGGRQHDTPYSLPSPANDVRINLMVGPGAVPCAVNPTARKRKHVSAIVIFTKQFHQFPGWRFAN